MLRQQILPNIKRTNITEVIYIFNVRAFFAEMEKPILKFIQNCKESPIAKTIFKKNKKVEQSPLPNVKTELQASRQYSAGIKTKTSMEQHWNPEINLHIHWQLIFQKGYKIHSMRKEYSLHQMLRQHHFQMQKDQTPTLHNMQKLIQSRSMI